MRLVVDANILVAELLRVRGKELLAHDKIRLFMAQKAWEETQHELKKRIKIISKQAQLSDETASLLLIEATTLAEKQIYIIDQEYYISFAELAKSRIPNDPEDWHTIALALALNADIWTQDKDFFGCGIPTWTTTTLKIKLNYS